MSGLARVVHSVGVSVGFGVSRLSEHWDLNCFGLGKPRFSKSIPAS